MVDFGRCETKTAVLPRGFLAGLPFPFVPPPSSPPSWFFRFFLFLRSSFVGAATGSCVGVRGTESASQRGLAGFAVPHLFVDACDRVSCLLSLDNFVRELREAANISLLFM